MVRRLAGSTLVLLATASLSCGGCGAEPTPDAGADMTPNDMARDTRGPVDVAPDVQTDVDANGGELLGRRTLLPDQAGVTDDGASQIDVSLDGVARAGRITTANTGFHGLWSHCKQGDFKLYNGRIEACISNEVSSRYESFAGGGLVDMRPAGQTGEDVFDLYAAKIGFNVAHPETVRVVRDGSDGGPAVVRAEGTDMPAAYFVGVAGNVLFNQLNLDVMVEYRLGPDEDFIEILTHVTNNTDRPAMVQKGDLLAWGDRADTYRQNVGFGTGSGEFSWIAAQAAEHAFAWVTPDDVLTSLTAGFGSPPWEVTQAPAFVLQPEETFTHFGRMVVGDLLDLVVRRAREFTGESVPQQRLLTLTNDDGAPVMGRRVEVFDAEGVSLSGGRTNASGRVPLSLPGGAHRIEIEGVLGGGGAAATLVVDADALSLTLPTTGRLRFSVTADGEDTPASVRITGADTHQGATWANRDEVELMPGEWTVTLGRGPEFDWVTQNVTVVAGEVTGVTAALSRLIDTDDWFSADFHQHMEPSSDSEIWLEDRVLDNAGQGVEFVVPTDHDVVTDLAPVIAAAGLTGLMGTFPGVELSPALAHANIYPMPWVRDEPGRGTIPLSSIVDGTPRRRSVPELIALARALPTDPVVQLNHTRDSAGLFDLVDFDPELGPDAVTHSWFTTDFDAMEITNGDECQQFKDWAGLWNAGIAPTPIGSSDSHSLWGDAGSGRTYLYAPGTAIDELTSEQVRDIVKSGQVVVGTSVFVDFTDGTLPGQTVDGSSGSVEFGFRVQSASWVGVDEIRVIVNGVQTDVIAVTPVDATVDFDATIAVPITEDSWVSFLATGAATGALATRKRPYAFTNAVRVDFDGGGFSSPGVRPLELDQIPLCN